MNPKRILLPACALASALLLAGCPDRDDDDQPEDQLQTLRFDVSTTNLTAAQPVSPLALALHQPSLSIFTVGAPASLPLEVLAEGGDNSDLLASLADNPEAFSTAAGSGVLMPGQSELLSVSAELGVDADVSLSLVTMLVNTNDAISALNGVDVTNLGVGDSMTFTTVVYDAGTEANSETADTIPGPAAAGGAQEGFNAARDEPDAVLMHSGVLTRDDGMSTSTLTGLHKFDNPALRITITRTQ
ncbi:spondin domain-containing protein [Simiduia sp. 21SJ11W-1]|uniref:spondin domain-containing protein n=1 Tax=Simiduia sp. 21SJ11W-1 TaxID=2909669 RepID=UPI00209F8D7F|nr:spondin domain-containing protein [Simiduia sp. 21SJ11W-1]UTA46908.1 spondin domain-containing protein [Simiduia sp. 21SJ11W-1]